MNEPVSAHQPVIWSHPYVVKAPPHGMASDSTALASAAKVVGLVAVLLISGVLARRGMKVNYTRKINHFAIFFIPVFIDQQLATETFTDVVYLSVSAVGTLCFLGIFLERVR
ncbi:MAG TPA: hypothetical protein D7I05_01505, partial [Candidatus Poseidoniales archaeon]